MRRLTAWLGHRDRARNANTAAGILFVTAAVAFALAVAFRADGHPGAWLAACTVMGFAATGAFRLNGWASGWHARDRAVRPRTDQRRPQ